MVLFDFFRKKKPAKDTASTNDSQVGTRHCFVLCRDEEPQDLSRASEVAAEVFGYGYTAEVGPEHIVTIRGLGYKFERVP